MHSLCNQRAWRRHYVCNTQFLRAQARRKGARADGFASLQAMLLQALPQHPHRCIQLLRGTEHPAAMQYSVHTEAQRQASVAMNDRSMKCGCVLQSGHLPCTHTRERNSSAVRSLCFCTARSGQLLCAITLFGGQLLSAVALCENAGCGASHHHDRLCLFQLHQSMATHTREHTSCAHNLDAVMQCALQTQRVASCCQTVRCDHKLDGLESCCDDSVMML